MKVANKAALQAEIKRAIKAHGNEVDLNYIDTSQVTDMSQLFRNNATFNGDISKWETSSVTNMYAMFHGTTAFNGDISEWETLSVTNMSVMFSGATNFNQNISGWKYDKLEVKERRIINMFAGATAMQEDYKPRWVR